ncbi:MAG: BatD family protein [Fibrobacter sp.]|nr:BatD family protein [Fibrobacter sp.]
MNSVNDSTIVDESLNAEGSVAASDSGLPNADGMDGAVADSTGADGAAANPVPTMPTAEQLGISVVSGFVGENGAPQPMAVTVGDTFDFPVTVSWSVNGSALLVLPTSSANAKGITQLGVSQESARSVKDGKEVASITFTYKLVAQDTGDLHIPAMKFEIPTQMGTPIEMKSENVPVRVDAPFNPLPVIVGAVVALCIVFAGIWRARRRSAARASAVARNAAQDALREKMVVLKQRINTADSREWLLELENICKEAVPGKFVPAGETAASTRTAAPNGTAADSDDGWEPLLKEFAHARYGGGKRDAFELREIWKAAMKLLGVEEE